MIKALLAVSLTLFVHMGWAGESAVASDVVSGQVLEVKDVESYTYLRLKTSQGETWAAVGKASVKPGSKVTIEHVMTMHNFESKSLKKTFAVILFGNLAGGEGSPHGAAKVVVSDVQVARATEKNAKTVEEILSNGVALKDKSVVVRGRIVKYNPGIMGKNWIHLQDGTGKEGRNDILVTSTNEAALGDVVTVKGVVHNDRDFGAGYTYKVLIEDATLQRAAK